MNILKAINFLEKKGYRVSPPPPPPDMDVLDVSELECPYCLELQYNPKYIGPFGRYHKATFHCYCGFKYSIVARKILLMGSDQIEKRDAVYRWLMSKR